MPGEGHQKLTVEAVSKGFDQAAEDVTKVGQAEEGLEEQTTTSAKATKGAAEAQEKLNASESDYLELLREIDPRLGGFADGMWKASKVAGDFATAEINLGDVMQTASKAMAAQASTLKLLGAAGGVALGFMALAKAIQFVRSESERLREELKNLKAEQTEEEAGRIEIQKGVVGMARGRGEGGFAAEEQVEAERVVGGILDRGFVEDVELLKHNVAALAGVLSGKEIEQLTLSGFRAKMEAPREYREREARWAMGREETGELAERERERLRAERARKTAKAKEELLSTDPLEGQANLQKLLDEVAGGLDKEAVSDLTKKALELREEYEKALAEFERTGNAMALFNIPGAILRTKGEDLATLLEVARAQRAPISSTMYGWNMPGFGTAFEQAGGTFQESEAAKQLIQKFDDLARRLEENTAAMENKEGTTVNHLQFSRNTYPDAGAQRKNIVNGENRRDQREAG